MWVTDLRSQNADEQQLPIQLESYVKQMR